MAKVGFIGAGKVGTAIAARLNSKDYPVAAVYDLKPEAARYFTDMVSGCQAVGSAQDVADAADIVFITTTDDLITQVASEIKWRSGQRVIHCSGARSAILLEPARQQGALVGVFHPGMMFADKKQAYESLPGTTYDIEADEPMLTTLKELAAALGGDWVELKAHQRPVYHVAMELPCLYLSLEFRIAIKMMQALNIPEDKAIALLLKWIMVTYRNMQAFGTSRALTGPVDRGDSETIKKHIDGLRQIYPSVLPLYRELARQNIPFAIHHKSIDQKKAEELETILKEY